MEQWGRVSNGTVPLVPFENRPLCSTLFFIINILILTLPIKRINVKIKMIKVKGKNIKMKKLLFSAYSLDIGGIEKALITLTNKLQEKGYDITIVLEKKQGIFLEELNKNIKVVEYRPNDSKNIIKRKLINFFKRVKFILKYKNKFDFSACFATYSLSGSFTSRIASKNSCLWGHADYLTLFENNIEEMREFFKQRNYDKFAHIIFVSEEGKNSFLKAFPEMKEKVMVCNNVIDDGKIEQLSKEKIELKKESNIVTFINVGRHDEKQKKLSRIIEASKKLKEDGLKFKVLFIGEGQDTEKYKKQVEQYNLKQNIIFLGKKKNPYPYFKISDCVILTSDYEGYPVVFLESFILNIPLITTKVSDYQEVEGKYGYVTTKEIEDIYRKMKLFIKEGFKIKETFDVEKYNEDIIKKLEKIF